MSHRWGARLDYTTSDIAPQADGAVPHREFLNVPEADLSGGFDTLTLVGRSLFAVCRRLSQSGRVVPGVVSRSTEAAGGGTRDEVSLDVEDVVNGGVDGDEALG